MSDSFCESVTGIGPWHIRRLTKAGHKYGGGIDTPSLCERVRPLPAGLGGWDLEVEITEHHLTHACRECVKRYLSPPSPGGGNNAGRE